MYRLFLTASLLLGSVPSRATETIQLLPYQSLPVEYLYRSDQKGLLIDHSLGSGKTILALGFTEKYEQHPVFIIVPDFLKSNWKIVMERYGIHEKKNYTIYSYAEAAEKLPKEDLTKALVVIDEVHKLISRIRSPLLNVRQPYVDLYFSLKSAYKILALTGTPLYQDPLDLSYILNLVSGKDLLPFNEYEFRMKFTKIRPGRALWRGHVVESVFLRGFFPNFASLYAVSFVTGRVPSMLTGFGTGISSNFVIPIITASVPIRTYKLRMFDAQKLAIIAERYISFYEVPSMNKADYPQVATSQEEVKFSKQEYDVWLKLIDKGLSKEELRILLKAERQQASENDLAINSTLIQGDLLNIPGIGREISNIIFRDAKGSALYSEKFKRLLNHLRKANYPAVIYSNYYHLGITNVVRMLDAHKYQGRYRLLDPTTPLQEQIQIINDYNQGKVDILLLHPDITEGVSLNGTQEFHILEQVLNVALLEQIKGRVVRYQSHTALPKEKQSVKIIVWNSILSGMSMRHIKQRRQNWRRSYGEFNYTSEFGQGRLQIDKENIRKNIAPDQEGEMQLKQLSVEIEELKEVLRKHSIEVVQH
jgi:superfamily II DNA or RNA helicase